jgi:hypothetical protein
MADHYPQCTITIRIYPDRRTRSTLRRAVAFNRKSIDGRCLSSCPFYRQGRCKICD